MNNDEYLTSEQGLTQIKPELSRDEQMSFIDTFRSMQDQGNQQISEQTRNLGSNVPYSHGGLGGSNYFLSRHQTPQVNNMVANLKSAAQLSALNQATKNYQDNLKDKYNQAYRKAQKSAKKSQEDGLSDLLDKLNIGTNTGTPETINVNDAATTNPWNTSVSGKTQYGGNAYTATDPITGKSYVYQQAPTQFMTMIEQPAALGFWPDGSKMSFGSTYTQNGKVYQYTDLGTGMPSIYQRTYNFGG